MENTIIQLTADDFEEAMDFLNLIFGVYNPHDFESLIPAIYRPTDEHMAYNHAIKQNGRIRAIVGMYPITLHIGDVAVRIAGIGAVSTHRNDRDRGYMKALMNHCVEQMKAQGYHLSCLGGQRQRYRYYGYEVCGTKYIFTVNKNNIRHCYKDTPNIRFEPITSDDEAYLVKARTLHDAQPLHCERSHEDFYRYCVGWHNKPYAALDEDGRMVGYVVANEPSDHVSELCAEDDDIATRMVRAWVVQYPVKPISIDMHPLGDSLFYTLGQISEHVRVKESGNWQVFDWITVTDALMKTRCLSGLMADGAVVVDIDGYDAMRMYVDGAEAGCVATDARPDVTCDAPTAMRLLFGPLLPSLVMPLPAQAKAFESWCPLPLSIRWQDQV